jgi:hypothetical protein
MNWLNGEEHKLSLVEIEDLLLKRNIPKRTTLYQAHYYPAWLSSSTVSVILGEEFAELKLIIWDSPFQVDTRTAINLGIPREEIPRHNEPTSENKWVEEQVQLRKALAASLGHEMKRLRAVHIPPPEAKVGRDGLLVEASLLIVGRQKNSFQDWTPENVYWDYFWLLCKNAMKSLEEKRSLKYLIALLDWLDL